MLKNLLMLILVCSSVSVFAKTNKVASPKIPLKFDIKYYGQLSYANRDKYLKILTDLAVKIEKDQHGKRTASHFFNLESLLLPYADAAATKTCVYGGIAMQMATCPSKLTTMPAEYANTEFFSCAAGQNRCSLAMGISATGKGYCYANSVVMATAECEKVAKADVTGGMGGTERLTAALDKCQKFPSSATVNCGDIVRALSKDTEAMATYCATRNSSYCAIAKQQITKLNPYVKAGTNATIPPVGGRDGCAEAEQAVIGDALNGSGVSPLWMKLISMTRQTCTGTSNIMIDQQLKRFGTCGELTSPTGTDADVETAIAKSEYLGPAINKMMNPGTGAFSNNEKKAFQEYFGITPTEYNKLFCESNSTTEFYDKLGSVVQDSTKPAGDTLKDPALFNWFVNQDDLQSRLASIPQTARSTKFNTALKSYAQANRDLASARSNYDTAVRACNGGAFPVECAKVPDLNSIAGGRGAALEALKYEFTQLNSGSSPMTLEALIGKPNLDAAKSAVNQNSSGMSEAAYAQRSKFKACVGSAIKTRMSGGRLKAEEAYSNVDNKCHQTLVTRIDGRTKYGKLSIMDNAQNKCYTSDGVPKADGHCPSGSSITTNYGANGNASDNICLDPATMGSRYTMFAYVCGNTPAESSVEGNGLSPSEK